MDLAVILVLTLLLAVALFLTALARHRAVAAEAANRKLKIEIRERTRAEDAARTSRQLMQSVADHSPAVIYVKDLDGRYLLINRRYEELFRVRAEEMTGRTD